VTSLGLVQMTRKRVGSGLIEVFSETCQHCNGRGFIIHTDPVDRGVNQPEAQSEPSSAGRRRGGRGGSGSGQAPNGDGGKGAHGPSGNGRDTGGSGRSDGSAPVEPPKHTTGPTAAQIAAAAHAAALKTAAVTVDGHPHAFPDDTGPWSGDDDHAGTAQDETPAVELESDVTDATTPQTTEPQEPQATEPETTHHETTEHRVATEPDVTTTEPHVTAEVVSEAPVEVAVTVEPAPRGRRRRGRVVAPAGPPRGHAAGADGGVA
jgi:ribonuclease E